MNPAEPNDRHGAVRIHGVVDGVIQQGWSINEDQYGLLTGNVSIRYETSNIPSWAMNSNGGLHPFSTELRSYKSSVTFGGGNNAIMNIDYIGIGNGRSRTIPEVEVSSSSATNNVVLHPRFSDLALAKLPDKDGNGAEFYPYVDTKNKNGVDFECFNAITAPEGLRGVDSYYALRATVRVTFYTYDTGLVSKHLNGISCWKDEPYGAEGFNGLPTGGNYLLTSCSASRYGTTYKISAEWTSSEQGVKWSELLYRKWGNMLNAKAQALVDRSQLGIDWSLHANLDL